MEQLGPPALLLLLPLNEAFNTSGNNGPGATFLWLGLLGILLIPCLFLLMLRLFRWRSQPLRWVRPLATLLLLVAGLASLQYSWRQATDETGLLAQRVTRLCKLQGQCPAWLPGSDDGKRGQVGGYLRYPLRYETTGSEFRLTLLLSVDMAEVFQGGRDVPLRREGSPQP
ncbi:hypothetical protein [Chitinilyticum litopenaei]|uniref:hypothetical protein n=1 Tax=Chitinilyticum litopenaei TaxID=1121276 RepID=UPI00041CD4E1|nr:hypothetical protein [Chitinilyticum litopenaei]